VTVTQNASSREVFTDGESKFPDHAQYGDCQYPDGVFVSNVRVAEQLIRRPEIASDNSR
jgi:hypothetical protein